MKSRVIVLLLLMALGGCVRIDIGDTVPTLGEELMSLERARAAGIVTEEELSSLRLAVLARY